MTRYIPSMLLLLLLVVLAAALGFAASHIIVEPLRIVF